MKAIKNQMGTAAFAAQYMEAPQLADGSTFRRKWFKVIPEAPKIDYYGFWVVSIEGHIPEGDG